MLPLEVEVEVTPLFWFCFLVFSVFHTWTELSWMCLASLPSCDWLCLLERTVTSSCFNWVLGGSSSSSSFLWVTRISSSLVSSLCTSDCTQLSSESREHWSQTHSQTQPLQTSPTPQSLQPSHPNVQAIEAVRTPPGDTPRSLYLFGCQLSPWRALLCEGAGFTGVRGWSQWLLAAYRCEWRRWATWREWDDEEGTRRSSVCSGSPSQNWSACRFSQTQDKTHSSGWLVPLDGEREPVSERRGIGRNRTNSKRKEFLRRICKHWREGSQ